MWSVVLEKYIRVNETVTPKELFIAEVAKTITENEAIKIYEEICDELGILLNRYSEPRLPMPEGLQVIPGLIETDLINNGYYL
jgi:hypothetical protein